MAVFNVSEESGPEKQGERCFLGALKDIPCFKPYSYAWKGIESSK